MIGRQDRHSFTIDKYIAYKDVRPPKEKLEEYAEHLSTSSRLSTVRVGVDAFIDLAVADPQRAETHIGRAALACDYITDQVEYLYDNDFIKDAQKESEYAAQAVLRKFELPMWLAAAQGKRPQLDYRGGIEASVRAVKDYTETNEGYAKVVEFLPILLFERAARRRVIPRHIGRMALSREDFGERHVQWGSPNWDCGFTAAEETEAEWFANPQHKLQVKLGKTRASSYVPHIAVVGARNFHFGDVEQILETLLMEEGLESSFDVATLRKEQVDHLTKGIREVLLDPSKSGQSFRMLT